MKSPVSPSKSPVTQKLNAEIRNLMEKVKKKREERHLGFEATIDG
jgi:hypothetical protein